MSKKIVFEIASSGDPASGMCAYTDTIEIAVGSGDPGGEEGDFAEYMRTCLASWYDGAAINVK